MKRYKSQKEDKEILEKCHMPKKKKNENYKVKSTGQTMCQSIRSKQLTDIMQEL